MVTRIRKKQVGRRSWPKWVRDNWLSILTLFLGGAALILAWRGNEIAVQQYKSNVIVLNSKTIGVDFDGTHPDVTMLGCMERHRLANLGSAANSIVGYDTIIYYKDTFSEFKGHGEAWNSYSLSQPSASRTTDNIADLLRGIIDRLDTQVVPLQETANKSPINDTLRSVPFPISVEANSAFDLEMTFVYGLLRGNQFNVSEGGAFFFPDAPKDLPPLEHEFVFKLATGEAIRSTRIECYSVGQ